MSDPYIAEIRLFAGNFTPRGWLRCDGQLIPIAQNIALFALLGTTYGGDGRTNFALPKLNGRAPLHAGQGFGLSSYEVGQQGGAAAVRLGSHQMPAHSHAPKASKSLATVSGANNGVLARTVSPNPPYHEASNMRPLGAAALGAAGGGQPHNNLQPYLELIFMIAVQGVFPSRP
jgi:microcystin-dependent protein